MRATRAVPGSSSPRSPSIVATPLPTRTYSTSSSASFARAADGRRRNAAAAARTPRSPFAPKSVRISRLQDPAHPAQITRCRCRKRLESASRPRGSGRHHKEESLDGRRGLGLVALVGALAVVAAGCGSSSKSGRQPPRRAVAPARARFRSAMLAPITGPAGSIGSDQLHWAQFFISHWNTTRESAEAEARAGRHAARPGEGFDRRAVVRLEQGDRRRHRPGGSDEVEATTPIFVKAGLATASGSATRVSLTAGKWKGYFFRDVPNDGVQGPTDSGLHDVDARRQQGDTVMVVDDQESYSTGLADIIGTEFKARASRSIASRSARRRRTSRRSWRRSGSTKVVFLPFQLASQAQLFAQQLRRRVRRRSCSAVTARSTRRNSTQTGATSRSSLLM